MTATAKKIDNNDTRGSVDINTVFSYLNALVFIFSLIFYTLNDFPTLINELTLIIYFFLFLQVSFFLKYEKRHRNPFILILVFFLVLFYFTRIVTIYWHDIASYSGVLLRLKAPNINDLNIALAFIFAANLMIFFGLYKFKIKKQEWLNSKSKVEDVNREFKVLMIFSFLLIVGFAGFPLMEGGSVASILGQLFSPSNVLLIVFVVLFISDMPRWQVLFAYRTFLITLIVISVALYVGLQALHGSRSGMFVALQMMLFSTLACEKYKINKKAIVLCLVLITFSVFAFTASTYLRAINYGVKQIDYGLTLQEGYSYIENANFNSENISNAYIPVFDRIAFLDFTVDMIKNSEEYRPVINIPSGIMSIVDGMTPGFDIFNAPKLTNALSSVYYGDPERLKRINDEGYQSDQFNVYGEYYVIFYGWLSLPFFTIMGFIFQKIYSQLRCKSRFRQKIWRAYILSIFTTWLLSFGFDWLVIYSVMGFISLWILLYLLDLKIVSFRLSYKPR